MMNPMHRQPPGSAGPSATPTRRAVLMPVMVALAAVTLVAAYLYWQELTRLPAPFGMIGTLAHPGATDGGMPDEGYGYESDPMRLPGTDAAQLLRIHPGDRELSAAEMVLPACEGAVNVMGLRRMAEGLVEEMSFYVVPGGDAEAVRLACRAAAEAAGFEPQPGGQGASELFARVAPPRHNPHAPPVRQMLVLRVSTHDQEVRTMVWLRYPMSR